MVYRLGPRGSIDYMDYIYIGVAPEVVSELQSCLLQVILYLYLDPLQAVDGQRMQFKLCINTSLTIPNHNHHKPNHDQQ